MNPEFLTERQMTEAQWCEVKRYLPPHLRSRVRKQDAAYRHFIDTVLWVVRHNLPWAHIPEQAGPWRPIYVRYVRWAAQGRWVCVCRALGLHNPLGEALRVHVERSLARGEWRHQRRCSAA